MKCSVCQSQTKFAFDALVLSKYDVEYHVCPTCHYLFAVEPYWLDEAYISAIASTDTGLVKRNFALSAKLACFLYFVMQERGEGRHADVAGGYGMLTRIMRDLGFNFFWQDKYCNNLLAQGFEFSASRGRCITVTAFEVLEHVRDPVGFIRNAMSETGADTIVFSTVLYEGQPPDPKAWWYYGFATGQHIGFFQRSTLEWIAKKLGLNFYTANKLHVLSKNKLPEKWFKLTTSNFAALLGLCWIRWKLEGKTNTDSDLLFEALHINNDRGD